MKIKKKILPVAGLAIALLFGASCASKTSDEEMAKLKQEIEALKKDTEQVKKETEELKKETEELKSLAEEINRKLEQ